METLFDLLEKKNKLPKGNVYIKKIKGKTYYYHQYRENEKNYSKLIDDKDVESLKCQIIKRKEIENKINQIIKKQNRELELSTSMKEYTGYIMSGGRKVAEFNKGELVVSSLNELSPIVITRTRSIMQFLKSRTIDGGRTNSRILRKILNIKVSDETYISLCSYAASISDNYWFKPKNSKLKYKDISFDSDMLFDTSLKGIVTVYPNKIVLSPELTTNGSYEKGWKIIDGEWWLYKVGNTSERYSEMFYSLLFEEIGLPTAHYELDGQYIRTRNFSQNTNFEPMISLVGEDEDIEIIYEELNKINHSIALDYLRLVTFDTILNNIDRHNENCGLLRERESGKIISLAPNYDDNLCLISRDANLLISKDEGFLKMFLKMIKKSEIVKNALKEIVFPCITKETLLSVHNKIRLDVDVDYNLIIDYILFRYKTVLEEINK